MFLVTAGITAPGIRLCSTETWLEGELHWREVGELPVKVAGIRAVTLDNRVFALGGSLSSQRAHFKILVQKPYPQIIIRWLRPFRRGHQLPGLGL